MVYYHQRHQGQNGSKLRIADPSSTQPEATNSSKKSNLEDLYWGDDDNTQPGIGPKQQETKMFPPYKPTPPETSNKLFVYGNLLRGFTLNVVVARDCGFIGSVRTPPIYRMINIADQYPAVLSGGKTSILGEVYEVYPRTIDFLDSVEDCPTTFRREIISLENGMRAHIYIINRWKTPSREEEIPSGDWIEWKKSERARRKERKERFLAAMAKGKIEAEQRRADEARREALAKTLGSNDVEASRVASAFRKVWDSKTQNWSYVKYEPTKSIHISDVQVAYLRIKLREKGIDPDNMTDATVRVHCMTAFGMWYAVEEVTLN